MFNRFFNCSETVFMLTIIHYVNIELSHMAGHIFKSYQRIHNISLTQPNLTYPNLTLTWRWTVFADPSRGFAPAPPVPSLGTVFEDIRS